MMKTLKTTGERAVIGRLSRLLPRNSTVIAGIGDDCAVVRSRTDSKFDFALTSDPVIEGVHFDKKTPLKAIGRKAAGRVLSDFAAMGAEPLWALVDLVAPARTPLRSVEAIYRGLSAMAADHGMAVVGGDTAEGPKLELHVFAVGRVPRGAALLRSGAQPGDAIFVTGSLGGSRARKHLYFEPRLEQGIWMGKNGWASSMIDLSDGLASDLRRITEMSGTGAVLDLDGLPLSPAAAKGRRKPIEAALFDGEDYELLFTVRPRKVSDFVAAWRRTFALRLSCLGLITGRRGRIDCVAPGGKMTELRDGGYEHFVGSDAEA